MNDLTFIQNLIQTIGFPIVVCGALAWYIREKDIQQKAVNEKHSLELSGFNEKLLEMQKVTIQAINNNSMVINKLADRIETIKHELEREK